MNKAFKTQFLLCQWKRKHLALTKKATCCDTQSPFPYIVALSLIKNAIILSGLCRHRHFRPDQFMQGHNTATGLPQFHHIPSPAVQQGANSPKGTCFGAPPWLRFLKHFHPGQKMCKCNRAHPFQGQRVLSHSSVECRPPKPLTESREVGVSTGDVREELLQYPQKLMQQTRSCQSANSADPQSSWFPKSHTPSLKKWLFTEGSNEASLCTEFIVLNPLLIFGTYTHSSGNEKDKKTAKNGSVHIPFSSLGYCTPPEGGSQWKQLPRSLF